MELPFSNCSCGSCHVSYVGRPEYLRSGSVSVNGGPSITGAYIGKNQRDPLGISAGFQASAIHELYVDGTSGQVSLAVVASTSTPFPNGGLPLYVLVMDSVYRFSQVIDKLPSTSGMKTTMGVVSDTSTRGSYASSLHSMSGRTNIQGCFLSLSRQDRFQFLGRCTPVTAAGGMRRPEPNREGSSLLRVYQSGPKSYALREVGSMPGFGCNLKRAGLRTCERNWNAIATSAVARRPSNA